MKKRVNGRTVDIKNIEIFEKAAGSLAINRTATSNTSDTSDGANGNYKTVGVYLDVDNGGLERYQVASEKLVKVREISGGDIQTTYLDFD